MKKAVLVSSMIFLMSGCIGKKLAVNNADTLLSHQVTKRIPLHSDEKKQLNKDVDLFLDQNKPTVRELLPILDNLKNIDAEVIDTHYDKLEGTYERVAAEFSLLLSRHMAKLDKKQQEEFFENIEEENREILKKNKQEKQEEREDRLEKFLGSVTGAQKDILKEYSTYFQERSEARLERRMVLQKKFREIYQDELSAEAKEKAFFEAFKENISSSLKNNKNQEILQKLLPTLKEKQRDHFRKKAEEIKELLEYYLTVDF